MKPPSSSYPGNKFLLYLRSTIFLVGMFLSTVIIAPLMILSIPLPFKFRYGLAQIWVTFNLWFVKTVCGLNYHIEGQNNIPKNNGIIVCKHQSAWETVALQKIFPQQVFILKRELLWLPFFGWAMATCDPIAINRKSGKAALRQVVSQGTERLKSGRWVVIFPEGTRVAPGERRKFGVGGGILASKSGFPVVPVAHNAGEFWGRYSFVKYPGTIQVRIGPPLYPQNHSTEEINSESESWIEDQMAQISSKPATL